MPVTKLEVRRQALGDVLGRPDRLVGPQVGDLVPLERGPEQPFGLGPVVADEDGADGRGALDLALVAADRLAMLASADRLLAPDALDPTADVCASAYRRRSSA